MCFTFILAKVRPVKCMSGSHILEAQCQKVDLQFVSFLLLYGNYLVVYIRQEASHWFLSCRLQKNYPESLMWRNGSEPNPTAARRETSKKRRNIEACSEEQTDLETQMCVHLIGFSYFIDRCLWNQCHITQPEAALNPFFQLRRMLNFCRFYWKSQRKFLNFW